MTLNIALIVAVAAVLFGIYWFATKRHRPDGDELAVVAEIPETGIFGVVLIALGFVMLIGKMRGMAIGGTEQSSVTFVAVFGVILVLAGVEIMLMSFIQRTIAYKDRIVSYNSFGNTRSIPWRQVTSVKVQPMSRKATFKSADESVSVNGKREEYIKLVQVAIEKVPPLVASDDLGRLLRALAK